MYFLYSVRLFYDCVILLLCNIPQSGGRVEIGESASHTIYTCSKLSRHTISALLESACTLGKGA